MMWYLILFDGFSATRSKSLKLAIKSKTISQATDVEKLRQPTFMVVGQKLT